MNGVIPPFSVSVGGHCCRGAGCLFFQPRNPGITHSQDACIVGRARPFCHQIKDVLIAARNLNTDGMISLAVDLKILMLRLHPWECCIPCLDDVLCYAKTFENIC